MTGKLGTCEFLFDGELGCRIREVASGRNVCCAIAFWSKDGVAEIFPDGDVADAKIVCDISMGSTSADSLSALGAPDNKRLRHKIGMHAKVCLSNKGLVVSSANASRAAMGSNDRLGQRLEAGTFHTADSGAWKAAAAWFEKLFCSASPIGPDEIAWARLVCPPKVGTVRQRPPREGSLLDLVLTAPEQFKTIGFVFAANPSTDEQRAEVRDHAEKIDPQGLNHFHTLPNHGIFYGWDTADVKRWPTYFVEFWQPKERLYIYGRRLEIRVPRVDSIMSIKDWRGLQAATDTELPSAQSIEKADAALALLIRGDEDSAFFASGVELARRIAELQPEP